MSALNQSTGSAGSRILAYGAARGDAVVTNDDIAGPINSSDEWIRQRTGIIERRRASKGLDAVDLAETASREAIERSGIRADQIGAVLELAHRVKLAEFRIIKLEARRAFLESRAAKASQRKTI